MSRISNYIGPKQTISPDELSRYENGQWAAEIKHDGSWACVETDNSGIITKITSRVGKPFVGDSVRGLIGLHTHLSNCVLAGELETASEAATLIYNKIGYRRFHIFDAPVLLEKDIRHLSYKERRNLLQIGTEKANLDVSKRLLLVESKHSGFKDFFDYVLKNGGEGIVLKRFNSKYFCNNSDGKIEEWIRAKPSHTVDYFVTEIGKTPGGSDNLKLGLWRNNKIEYVCTFQVPLKYKATQLVGRVVECFGAEIMKSGALRHARFKRIRTDKTKEMCTL